MSSKDNRPVYTIATAAELLGVHPRTLRLYEAAGLVKPARRNNRRIYSNNDLRWIRCIRYLIHEQGLNQEGIRRLLALMPCWEIRGCPPEQYQNCEARRDRTTPCWAIASMTCQHEQKCYTCDVYLRARERLLTEQELRRMDEQTADLP